MITLQIKAIRKSWIPQSRRLVSILLWKENVGEKHCLESFIYLFLLNDQFNHRIFSSVCATVAGAHPRNILGTHHSIIRNVIKWLLLFGSIIPFEMAGTCFPIHIWRKLVIEFKLFGKTYSKRSNVENFWAYFERIEYKNEITGSEFQTASVEFKSSCKLIQPIEAVDQNKSMGLFMPHSMFCLLFFVCINVVSTWYLVNVSHMAKERSHSHTGTVFFDGTCK